MPRNVAAPESDNPEIPADLPTPRAVVFDWDNTLVDTWPVIHASFKTTLLAMGQEPWTLEQTKDRVSKSLRDAFPELFGNRWEEARDIYYSAFEREHLQSLMPLDNALGTLDHLQGRGKPMALVSNKTGRYLRREVDHLSWNGYFRSVVGAGDAPHDKPDPEALIMALAPIGLSVGPDIWFVGDSRSDLELARNAGCTGILVHPDPDRAKTAFSDCLPRCQVANLDQLTYVLETVG
ncbi:HAD family hydrolase [Hwanghaeella grinnelliae]|uniref:HAD family hydrolase n=1 Tax=Hwanghaeella grinnelliae TaxID=2500179 RepID=UPI001386BB0F|nr:HAD family hydrolase [Hwanghaeella grinnelliae]